MSVDERLTLIETIWDSIDDERAPIPLSGEQQAELDGRLADMDENPNAGEEWEAVRAKLRNRH